MPRLLRPSINLETKLRVLCRQLGELFPDRVVANARHTRTLAIAVRKRLVRLAQLLGCEVEDLHLDHDPALVNREKDVQLPDGSVVRTVVVPKGARVVRYHPDANDPEHLVYRIGGAPGSAHDVKTRVRGENGQLSDLGLARKERKRMKKLAARTSARKKKRAGVS